jgi:hypothetical protein
MAVLADKVYWMDPKPNNSKKHGPLYLLFHFASAPPKCLNKDFTTVPSYVTHQWVPIAKNGSLMPFPYNTTVNGELR